METRENFEEIPQLSKCTHPDAVGARWGDPISDERKEELRSEISRWLDESDRKGQRGPFDGKSLSGADISYLHELSGTNEDISFLALHLQGADIGFQHLEGAVLLNVHLEGAKLSGT